MALQKALRLSTRRPNPSWLPLLRTHHAQRQYTHKPTTQSAINTSTRLAASPPSQPQTNPPATRDPSSLLTTQRLNRPTSPHLSLYRPNIALYGSGLNRITAVLLAGSLYLGGLAYLALPLFGYHVSTEGMVAVVAAWPAAVKVGVKGVLAGAFFYHGCNGVRHLCWDAGWGFGNRVVVRTGWGVLGVAVGATVWFVAFV